MQADKSEKKSVKSKVFGIYYSAQVGYGIWGWLAALVAYTSIVVLAFHLIIPTVSATDIAILAPIIGFVFFYITGFFAIKHNFYSSSQTFGGRKNPSRLNWEMELTKAKLVIEESNMIVKLAKLKGIDSSIMEEKIKLLESVQKDMEDMLR